MEIRPQQVVAAEFGLRARRWINGDPVGSGKTGATLEWLRRVFDLARPHRALVVAPLQVRHHWPDQAAMFSPDIAFFDGAGTPAKRRATRDAVWSHPGHSALVVGYEMMRVDNILSVYSWDAIIFDEAHRLKNRKAAVTKAARVLAKTAPDMAHLSATPILNGAEDLWTLLNMNDRKRWPSFWRWAHDHLEVEQTTFYGKLAQPILLVHGLKDGADAAIRAELADVMISRPIEELLPDLAEPVHTVLSVDLSPSERKLYDQLDKGWIEVGGEIILVTNAVSTTTRQRQIASDWTSLDPALGAGAKVTATLSLIEDLHPAPVVVMCSYKGAVDALMAGLDKAGTTAVRYTGDESPAQRETNKQTFVSGQAQVLVGIIQAVGEGTDGLQAVSRDIVLLDRDWTPARNDQVIGRLRRGGQTEVVRVWHIVARATVDQQVAKAIAEKRQIIHAIQGGTP